MQREQINQSTASKGARPPRSDVPNGLTPKPVQKKGIARPLINSNRITKRANPRGALHHMQKQLMKRLEPLMAPLPAGQGDLLADFTYHGHRYIDPEIPMRSVSLALFLESEWYYVQKLPQWERPQTYSKMEFRFKLYPLKNIGKYKVTTIDTVKVYLSTATSNDEPLQGKLYRWRF